MVESNVFRKVNHLSKQEKMFPMFKVPYFLAYHLMCF